MKLFHSKEEILGDQQFEEEFNNLFKELPDISNENTNTLNNILLLSKNSYNDDFRSKQKGLVSTTATISNSILVNFNILKQVHNNNKSIDTLIKQNKELENKLESKFDTIIKQNEELNNKFDQLIEILKSK